MAEVLSFILEITFHSRCSLCSKEYSEYVNIQLYGCIMRNTVCVCKHAKLCLISLNMYIILFDVNTCVHTVYLGIPCS